tara:strand:+ start:161 stop:577 length:417 start_codon:yes stop_codon:yes gene_type:complete
MNKRLYDSTLNRLRSQALEAFAKLEASLLHTAGDSSKIDVDAIVQHAEDLARLEGAIITLQQYFPVNKPQAPTPPVAPAPVPQAPAKAPATPPKKITEEMSPSYKKSIAAEEKRLKAQEARIKREKAAAKRKKETKDE